MWKLNVLKRAVFSTWHHKLWILLLFVLAFAAAFQLFQGFAMLEGMHVTESCLSNELVTDVNVTPYSDPNSDARLLGGYTPPLTPAMMKQLAAIPCVKSYNPVTYRGGISKDYQNFGMEAISPKYADDTSRLLQLQQPGTAYQFPNVLIENVQDTSKLGEFVYGSYTLKAGRHLTAADAGKPVAIMSSSVAKSNNLKLGDTFTVSDCYPGKKPLELRIVGLFYTDDADQYLRPAVNAPKDGTNPDYIQTGGPSQINSPRARIYVPFDLIDDTWWSNVWQKGNAQEANFYLKHPSDVATFEKAAKKISGMGSFTFLTHESLYQYVTEPYWKLDPVIWKSLILGFFICIVPLCLAAFLFIRIRKKEWRVLFTIGEKKIKIAGQMTLELLLPVIAAFVIAAVFPASPLIKNDQNQISKSYISMNSREMGTLVSGYNDDTVYDQRSIMGKYYPEGSLSPYAWADPMVTPRMLGEYAASGLVLVLFVAGVEGIYLRALKPSKLLH